MTVSSTPPRWDLSGIFPSLASRELRSAHEGIVADLGRLQTLYDHHQVRAGAGAPLTSRDVAAFEEVVAATNAFLEQVKTLSAYIRALVTTDASDDHASTLLSQLQADLVGLHSLTTRFEGWVARFGAPQLIAASAAAAAHQHALHQADRAATHQMSEGEESLYAELRLSGSQAWHTLHGELTARLTGTIDGELVPVTVLRGLATDPDAATRARAHHAEIAAWGGAAVPLAAALNAIKGEANTVNRRRGWVDSLEPALHANSVERAALDAMHEAAIASFPDFRRFLRDKARLLGHDGALPWWDLFAPVPGEAGVSWPDAADAVQVAFASYSQSLAGLARRAIEERWIDAQAREGKQGGAYCMSIRDGESRVMLNFDGSFDSVQTLAHELGHAYHNLNLAGRTAMQRRTPMAMAETASIFCETIMIQSGLASARPAERLALLNVDLQGACQVVVDIHSRFVFEREVSERRRTRVLSVAELCDAMRRAQLATYGDGLAHDTLHPYMWAVKPHYYSSAYYNWPYCFGLLFGTGLYARYREDPERFRAGYDDLLSSTGLGSAAELGARFDIDVTSVDFWAASLAVVRERIDEFGCLVDALGPGPTVPARPATGP